MDSSGTWFVTKDLQPRTPLLTTTGIADEIVNTLRFSVQEGRLALAAFCVTPDHWHVLFGLPELSLPTAMRLIDSWVGRGSSAILGREGVAWQDGYHDTRIVSGRQFSRICEYIEENPVRADLVAEASQWGWGSAQPVHEDIVLRPWPWTLERDMG